MTRKTLADWSDPIRYHGFQPPRSSCSWEESLFIYVIRAGGFVKIGVARDPVRRIEGLRAGCPFPIEVISLRTAPGILAFQVERRVHTELAAARVHGEWFQIDPRDVAPVLTRMISRSKLAREKWLRDGYLDWEPPLRRKSDSAAKALQRLRLVYEAR